MTREDWRKKKELEEQRKLGNGPAEVDEEWKDINLHVAQCISSFAWYIDLSKNTHFKASETTAIETEPIPFL